MPDALTVTTSVAGILSLGVQACSGIISYYESWSGNGQDIDYMLTKLKDLQGILQLLETMNNTNAISPTIMGQVNQPLLSCKDAISRLDVMVNKFRASGQPSTMSGKLNAQAKRALYPFRKQTLMDTMKLLEGLQLNLNTVLSVANLSQGSQMLSIVAETKKHTQRFSEFMTQSNSLHATMASLGPSKLVAQPACFRDLYNEHDVLQQAFEKKRQAFDIFIGQCQCPFPYTFKRRALPNQGKVHQARQRRHLRSCNYYLVGQQSEIINKDLKYCSKLLKFSLTFMIQMTNGAGGFSFSPSIYFRAIVDRFSGAFGALWGHLEYPGTPALIVPIKISDLQALFSAGKARAMDRCEDGFGLLHVACRLLFSFMSRSSAPIFEYSLITFLLESGARADITDDRGESPLDLLVRSISHYETLREYRLPCILNLIDHGAFITDHALTPDNKQEIRLLLENCNEACYISDLAQCIIFESVNGLRGILESGSCSVDDKIGHYVPLQLVNGWPEGLQILLQAGADIKKPCPITILKRMFPLDWVISWKCISSVKLMLDAGAPVTARAISQTSDDNIETLLIGELVTRRTKLKVLGKIFLSLDEQQEMGLLDNSLPDSKAFYIYKVLLSRGVPIEPTLDPRQVTLNYVLGVTFDVRYDGYREKYCETVFHCEFLTCRQMQKLYDAGFHDCHSLDEFQHTPLSYHSSLESPLGLVKRAMWIISKNTGSNGDNDLMGLRSFIIALVDSFIYVIQGNHSISWEDFLDVFDTVQYDFLIRVIATERTDACLCGCSLDGCSVLSTALKEVFSRYVRSDSLETFMAIASNNRHSSCSFIRFLTFHDLRITHTCCKKPMFDRHPKPIDPEEASHIRWEQEELLLELEELLSKFLNAFDDLNLPLAEFLKGYWSREMKEHLLKRKGPLTENLQACKDIGVHLEPGVSPLLKSICLLLQPVAEDESVPDTDEAGFNE